MAETTSPLTLWVGDIDFVIAPTRERAAELAREAAANRMEPPEAIAEITPDSFSAIPPDDEFTLHDADGRGGVEVRTAAAWCASGGERWFACSEY